MKFTFRTWESPSQVLSEKADAVVIPVLDADVGVDPVLGAIDGQLSGYLRQAISDEQFAAKATQSLSFHTQGKLGATRLTLLGASKPTGVVQSDVKLWTARAIRSLPSTAKVLTLCLRGVSAADSAAAGQSVAEGARLVTYQFDKYMSGDRKKRSALEEVIVLLPPEASTEAAAAGAQRGQIIADGVCLTRDLVNEQPTEMCPRRLAEVAIDLAQRLGLGCTVLGVKECEALGMGMFLGVGRGSVEEPRFIHLTYKPATTPRKKVALIGKSVTFDSGGLSIKTTEGMLWMKMDMGGGAAVLGAISALARLGCPDEVHILCAATENMPSGNAYKLGDVLRAMNGKTIEITNTDAEGRLTLADAITYAVTHIKPDEIIDFATLTGACEVALGPHTAGVMTNQPAAAGRVLDAARAAGEEMWQLPLPDRLMEALKSDVADMKNCGDRKGGCLTAGLFLKEFVGDTTWVHVDMAGPVKSTSEWGHQGKGATGFGVASIVEYLIPRS